jgi:predicted methyltransferase
MAQSAKNLPTCGGSNDLGSKFEIYVLNAETYMIDLDKTYLIDPLSADIKFETGMHYKLVPSRFDNGGPFIEVDGITYSKFAVETIIREAVKPRQLSFDFSKD